MLRAECQQVFLRNDSHERMRSPILGLRQRRHAVITSIAAMIRKKGDRQSPAPP
ncbi:permease [Ralstonia solanacearum]|nr:permease [Ralstonia solanacearum]